MIDYLLKFDSKDQALTFAEQMGFTTTEEDGNGIETTMAISQSEDHSYTVIGEHFVDTGKTETIRDESGMEWEQPIMQGDGKHWVLFRDIKGDMDAEPAEEFIIWHSNMTERIRKRDENGQFIANGYIQSSKVNEIVTFKEEDRLQSLPYLTFLLKKVLVQALV
jgi:hypothetical protein